MADLKNRVENDADQPSQVEEQRKKMSRKESLISELLGESEKTAKRDKLILKLLFGGGLITLMVLIYFCPSVTSY
jgi:hypothetical protein